MCVARGGFSFIQANIVSNQEQVSRDTLKKDKELGLIFLTYILFYFVFHHIFYLGILF